MSVRRLLSLALALLLALSLLAAPAAALEGDPKLGALSYRAEGDHIIITECDMAAEGALTVPAEIDGLPVTEIGDRAFHYCEKITLLTLPDTVTTIRFSALSSMHALREVRLSENLRQLGEFVFSDCTALTAVTLPEGITTLPRATFLSCSSLETVVFPSHLRVIGEEAFELCASLRRMDIPDSVRVIERMAFLMCRSLEEIRLSENLTELSDRLFEDCAALREISIPERVHTLGDGVFTGCASLESVTLPDGVRELPNSLFSVCKKLREVHFGNQITAIGEMCFAGCESLEYLQLPDTILTIGGSAFQECASIVSIRLPQKLQQLNPYLFANCLQLEEVILPADLRAIRFSAFLNCPKLERLYYSGSEYALRQIEIEEEGNDALRNAVFYVVPDGTDSDFGLWDLPPKDHWAYEGIAFCLRNGLMKGTGDGYFQPNATTTRAQLVTILWRMCEEPAATKPIPFTDCGISWADPAIAWAAENGIVSGVGNGLFAPNQPVSRQELVTIFYRFCRDYLELDVSNRAELSAFPDHGAVASWARDAFGWAVAEKIISGVGTPQGTILQPGGSANRAQIARVILNFARNLAA